MIVYRLRMLTEAGQTTWSHYVFESPDQIADAVAKTVEGYKLTFDAPAPIALSALERGECVIIEANEEPRFYIAIERLDLGNGPVAL